MSATKILWGQVLVVALIVLASVWGATQWTAWQLGYQPELGRPWFVLMGHPIYAPPAFFWWWSFFDAYAPKIFYQGRSEESRVGKECDRTCRSWWSTYHE